MRLAVVIVALATLAGCSSSEDKLERAVKTATGWGGTIDAITSPELRAALPTHYVAKTCTLGAESVNKAATSVESLRASSDPATRASIASLDQLSDLLPALADDVQHGRTNHPRQSDLRVVAGALKARSQQPE